MDQGDFVIETRGKQTVLRPTIPSLMEESQVAAFEACGQAQVRANRTELVVDFSEVQYVSSRLVGALLNIRKASVAAAGGGGGAVTLVGMRPALLELVKLVRLDKMFKIKATVAAAA